MAKFEVIMQYVNADGTEGVLRKTVTGKIKVRRQCKKNREWFRERGHREISVSVIPVGSYAHRVRVERARVDEP